MDSYANPMNPQADALPSETGNPPMYGGTTPRGDAPSLIPTAILTPRSQAAAQTGQGQTSQELKSHSEQKDSEEEESESISSWELERKKHKVSYTRLESRLVVAI